MTRLELMELAEDCADVLTAMEDELLKNIAGYLSEGRADIPTAQWKIQQLASLGKLDKANIRTIAEYSGIAADMEEIAMTRAALQAVKEMDDGFGKLVSDGIIKGTAVSMEESALQAAAMYRKQARDRLNKVNTVMRYFAKNTAAAAINRTAEIVNKQQHLDILNRSAGKVIMGAESRQTAVRQCIKEMSAKGIPAFVDAAGRQWSPEAYINMDVRTTCSNTAHEAQFTRMDDYGIDLIETSSHAGARPKCALDQGKIFSRSGKNKKYPSWKTSSYGQPDGILGINCGHQIYPYIEGVSVQRYFPVNEEENDRLYKQKQEQRQLEREVRAVKRECSMLDAAGDKEGFAEASVRLKSRQERYKAYCENNGLPMKKDRLQASDFDRSKSSKTVWAERKAKNMVASIDHTKMQYYNRLSDEIKTSAKRFDTEINLTAIEHTHSSIYLSDKSDVRKPKQLHEMDIAISKAKNTLHISENEPFPDIFVITPEEMGKNVPGAYNPVKNQLYLVDKLFVDAESLQEQFACSDNKISTIIHELFHWLDATEYRRKNGDFLNEDDYKKYISALNSKAKKELDKAAQKGYNINDISYYAKWSFDKEDYNEAYTEYRTMITLKE